MHEKLKSHREQIFGNFKSHLPINFKGLSTFRDQVVYVDLVKDEYYKQLISLQSKFGLKIEITRNPRFLSYG